MLTPNAGILTSHRLYPEPRSWFGAGNRSTTRMYVKMHHTRFYSTIRAAVVARHPAAHGRRGQPIAMPSRKQLPKDSAGPITPHAETSYNYVSTEVSAPLTNLHAHTSSPDLSGITTANSATMSINSTFELLFGEFGLTPPSQRNNLFPFQQKLSAVLPAGAPQYPCEDCDRAFKSLSALQSHADNARNHTRTKQPQSAGANAVAITSRSNGCVTRE